MAVYTALTRDDIEALLAHYDLGALESFEGIAEGVSNTNYLLTVGGTPYILTLFESGVELGDLPYFMAVMAWWKARGIECPQPIAMKDGRVLTAVKERPAVIVSFLEGSGVQKITVDHLAKLGALTAKMHIAGAEFPHHRTNPLSVKGWEALIDQIIDDVERIDSDLRSLLNEEFNYLSEHWPEDLPSGPVHADLFPDNVFFHKAFGKPPVLSGVIDFYFACNDMWAYDLAICVNAWCFDERHRLVPERVQALMQSYNVQRPMTHEEEAAFPLLLRGAALRFLLTRARDLLNTPKDAVVTCKDPMEYVAKLRFHQSRT